MHVQEVGLADARDDAILDFAAQNGFVLVSKDEDFLHLALARRESVQLVWVRLGNCRTRYLLSAFGKAMPALVAAITDGQTVVEIR